MSFLGYNIPPGSFPPCSISEQRLCFLLAFIPESDFLGRLFRTPQNTIGPWDVRFFLIKGCRQYLLSAPFPSAFSHSSCGMRWLQGQRNFKTLRRFPRSPRQPLNPNLENQEASLFFSIPPCHGVISCDDHDKTHSPPRSPRSVDDIISVQNGCRLSLITPMSRFANKIGKTSNLYLIDLFGGGSISECS